MKITLSQLSLITINFKAIKLASKLGQLSYLTVMQAYKLSKNYINYSNPYSYYHEKYSVSNKNDQ